MNIIIKQEGEDQTVQVIDQDSTQSFNWSKIRMLFHIRLSKRFYWFFAVTSIMVICSVSYYQYINRPPLEIRLYNKYYKPLDGSFSDYFIENSAFEQGKNKYFEGDQVVALLLLSNLPEDTNRTDETLFYKGLILMELNRYNEACNHFNEILLNEGNHSIFGLTNWYLGLSYLRLNNIHGAIASFKKITANNSLKYKEAKELIDKLKI